MYVFVCVGMYLCVRVLALVFSSSALVINNQVSQFDPHTLTIHLTRQLVAQPFLGHLHATGNEKHPTSA